MQSTHNNDNFNLPILPASHDNLLEFNHNTFNNIYKTIKQKLLNKTGTIYNDIIAKNDLLTIIKLFE